MTKKNKLINNPRLYDSSSKLIFGDNILCSQFLRDFADVEILKNIRPEDIEDVSERYVPLYSTERDSDTVKKVDISKYIQLEKDENTLNLPLYIVSLIEHKSKVEYNVVMQILRYMVYIWEDYEKEMLQKYPGISDRKDFRYPPVFPIVYYEGTGKWTAPFDLADRIFCGELLKDYLPHFKYQMIRLHDYSNGELLAKGDEIALAMLINKIRNPEDMEAFTALPEDQINRIIQDTPDYLLDTMGKLLRALLYKMEQPEEETEEAVAKIKERKRGMLFDSVTFSFKRAIEEAAAEAAAKARAEVEEKVEAEAKQKEIAENKLKITKYIMKMLVNGHPDTEIKEALQKEFGFTGEQAEEEYREAVE